MAEHRYGDAWEEFPIRPGEVWVSGGSAVTVGDMTSREVVDGLLGNMTAGPDLTYTDPPWGQGKLSAFYTKANLSGPPSWAAFCERLVALCKAVTPRWAFVETGIRWEAEVLAEAERQGATVLASWGTTYYRKHPGRLLAWTYTGAVLPDVDLTGVDDDLTPGAVMNAVDCNVVFDPCCGRGLTAETAWKQDREFVGIELNPRRAAWVLRKGARLGRTWSVR